MRTYTVVLALAVGLLAVYVHADSSAVSDSSTLQVSGAAGGV